MYFQEWKWEQFASVWGGGGLGSDSKYKKHVFGGAKITQASLQIIKWYVPIHILKHNEFLESLGREIGKKFH